MIKRESDTPPKNLAENYILDYRVQAMKMAGGSNNPMHRRQTLGIRSPPPPPKESDGLCDCKHHRHGLCLGRETSPVKKGSGLACAKPSEKMDLD